MVYVIGTGALLLVAALIMAALEICKPQPNWRPVTVVCFLAFGTALLALVVLSVDRAEPDLSRTITDHDRVQEMATESDQQRILDSLKRTEGLPRSQRVHELALDCFDGNDEAADLLMRVLGL